MRYPLGISSRTVNMPVWPGSPWSTAIRAPAGNTGGAGPQLRVGAWAAAKAGRTAAMSAARARFLERMATSGGVGSWRVPPPTRRRFARQSHGRNRARGSPFGPRSAGREQTLAGRVSHGGGARRQPQPGEEVGDVALDGVVAEPEPRRDLRIAQPLGDEAQDLDLP